MASNPKSRAFDNVDERGAGGKILQGRRVTKALIPYQRPTEADRRPAPSEVERKGWFSSLISGAGRILSSVLPMENESCSSSSSSDSEPGDDLDLVEYRDASDEDVNMIDESGTKFDPNESQIVDHQLVASTSKTKISIENLLKQETYTRDESKRLMKIIESRVVRSPSSEKCKELLAAEVLNRDIYLHAPKVVGLSSQNYLLGGSPHSSGYLRTFHPSLSAETGDLIPHTSNVAIMEAKKWVEDKRHTSSSKSCMSCTPCTMNTDMLNHDDSSDVGSPVDVAKSYMHALPPWRSQIIGSVGFKGPSSMEHKITHMEADAGDFVHAFSADIESFDTHKKGLELGPFFTSSESDKRVRQVYSKVLDSTTLSDATENVNGGCSDAPAGNFSAPFTKNTKSGNPFSDLRASVFNNIPASEEITNVGKAKHGISADVAPLASEAKPQSTSFISYGEIYETVNQKFVDDQVIDVKGPSSPTEGQAGTITGHGTCTGDALVSDHNDALTAEPIILVSGDTTCSLSRYSEIAPTEGSPPSIRVLERDEDSTRDFSDKALITEAKHHDESRSTVASNGALDHQTSSLLRSETHGKPNNPSEQKATETHNNPSEQKATRADNGTTAPDDSIKLLHEDPKVPTVNLGRSNDEQLSVTIKQMLTEPSLSSNHRGVRGRARKAVARRRGKGRITS